MDAQANSGLLLDDDDDTLVPIGTGAIPAVPSEVPPRVEAPVLVHPSMAPPELLDRAVTWVSSPHPTLGVRAAIFVLTGLNFGVSRRERELRESFCALYRAAHHHPNHERRT